MRECFKIVFGFCLTLSGTAGAADTGDQEWTPVAFLEFGQESKEFAAAVALEQGGKLTETEYQQSEKKRVETLKRIDPDTGKTIVETETVVSGKAADKTSTTQRTFLLTIDASWREEDGERVRQFRLAIDGVEQFAVPAEDMKTAKKLCRAWMRALEKARKTKRGQPYVSLVFGDKTRGFEYRADHMAPRPDLGMKVMGNSTKVVIWIGGRVYAVNPQGLPLGFVADIADVEI